jgi:hypothetical protein
MSYQTEALKGPARPAAKCGRVERRGSPTRPVILTVATLRVHVVVTLETKMIIVEPGDAELAHQYRLKVAEEMIHQFMEWRDSLPPEQRPEDTTENFEKWVATPGMVKLDADGKVRPRY